MPGEIDLTPEVVVRGYCVGAFPMARGRSGRIDWFRPDPRAIMPLDERFHVRRSLGKRVRNGPFKITRDRAFERVMRQCAKRSPGREQTWINEPIIRVYTALHRAGLAHSVEAWVDEKDEDVTADGQEKDRVQTEATGDQSAGPTGCRLVGGLYGVALGAAFFGESMFSRQRDASQICLVHLVERLRQRGYTLLDVQYANPHLEQFGLLEISCASYLARLDAALREPVTWATPKEKP